MQRSVDLLWLGILGVLWGASYLFIKVIVAEVPALTLVASRLLLGAIILWIVLCLTKQPVPRGWGLWGAYATMGLLSGALPYSLISWGEQYIDSGLASLLQATTPVFTVLLAGLLAEERLTPARLGGVAVGFAGVGLLMLPDLGRGLHASIQGQLAIVASSVCYAAAAIFARSRLRGQPPLASTTGQLTMGAAFMVPASLLIDRPSRLSPSLPAVASWLALTLLGTVVAYVIYYALIKRTSATYVSTVTYIIPVNGLLLGALVLREPVGVNLLAGLALVLLGVLLVRR